MPRSRSKTTTSRSSSSSSSSATVEARVLVDVYRWHDEFGDTDSPVHTWDRNDPANSPDTITVSKEEFDRGQKLGALAKASAKDARRVDETPQVPSDLNELSDQELRDLAFQVTGDDHSDDTREQLFGVVAAAPGGNERPQV
jgi:hypothetical protein